MADREHRPAARGDEAELFRTFNGELMRTVAAATFVSSPQIIEDACAFAWAQFIERQPDRDRNWQGWLYRTAQREVWALERHAHDHAPLTADSQARGSNGLVAPDDRYQQRLDLDEALTILSELPPRLRRIATLRALGLGHAEIGAITGDGPVRVYQLVTRANEHIYEALAEQRRDTQAQSPRATRLQELEEHTPVWLAAKIGRVPRLRTRSRSGATEHRRAWRRAALALDDYRQAAGPDAFRALTAEPPKDPALRDPHRLALRALDDLEHQRGRARGRATER